MGDTPDDNGVLRPESISDSAAAAAMPMPPPISSFDVDDDVDDNLYCRFCRSCRRSPHRPHRHSLRFTLLDRLDNVWRNRAEWDLTATDF